LVWFLVMDFVGRYAMAIHRTVKFVQWTQSNRFYVLYNQKVEGWLSVERMFNIKLEQKSRPALSRTT